QKVDLVFLAERVERRLEQALELIVVELLETPRPRRGTFDVVEIREIPFILGDSYNAFRHGLEVGCGRFMLFGGMEMDPVAVWVFDHCQMRP
ncbi:hypothetical protein CH063_11478, partial [Colletotrichum higginsianum]